MTRKCVMCKETNYRNSYSFFSAPKDPEMRQKWQNAIGIDNYAVTDDTYVCSKHFHKDDIITHWASGVPPYVITIKYKKCRLRPGAVPGKNYPEENVELKQEHSDDFDENFSPFKLKREDIPKGKRKNFLVSKAEEKLEINCYEKHRIPLYYKYTREIDDHNYMPNAKLLAKTKPLNNETNMNDESYDEPVEKKFKQIKRSKTTHLNEDAVAIKMDLTKDSNSDDKGDDQDLLSSESSLLNASMRVSEPSSKDCHASNKGDMLVQVWEHKAAIKDEPTDNKVKQKENSPIENQIVSNYNELDTRCTKCSDSEENEMLFEDLLEVYTEVLLPRGWSCLVTSTGLAMTVVYMYMGMTKSGMPYTEKQVFIKSDMTMRCVAVSREINPLTHNLIREGKHLRIQNLLDIEELIDEFDQRTICQGMYNPDDCQEVIDLKVVYKDGVKWRHILCPLLMNNGSIRCTRCITLSHKIQRRPRIRHPLAYNLSVLRKNEQRIHALRQMWKRLKKRNRKREFINVSEK
ncbi:PREDICTED: uncharacterized protein LOC107186205 [Dufourea novaeangliae]|uniref:uncharacterized protein LOC107186205 n=1 Tax=Dufourea novaeangliae TaxID=178035 RepID=UPI0007673D47|nr:PREDICTED: uncharacterized protein LOC107186205 [Dufourea novaeangliae]